MNTKAKWWKRHSLTGKFLFAAAFDSLRVYLSKLTLNYAKTRVVVSELQIVGRSFGDKKVNQPKRVFVAHFKAPL